MPDQYFIEQYRHKATLEDPVAQTGRGQKFDALSFLHMVHETLGLLELQPQHNLLNVGCANGLIDILLSACCKRLLAIDPIEEMVTLARQNLRGYENVQVALGHAASIPAEARLFDRVLMLEVIQLINEDELSNVFEELHRVTHPSGKLLIGAVPDVRFRDAHLNPYLEGVRNAQHLSQAQKDDIIQRNERSNWFHPDTLIDTWKTLGRTAKIQPLSDHHPNADFRFYLLVGEAQT